MQPWGKALATHAGDGVGTGTWCAVCLEEIVRTDSPGDQEEEGWSLHRGRRCEAAGAGREKGW